MATIRPAVPDDSETIANLIRELAVYEKLEHEARASPEMIREHLFGPRPFAEVLMAEEDGQAAGFALFFHNFSTFRGQPGLYLEDLFVRPEHRGKGIGKALLAGARKACRRSRVRAAGMGRAGLERAGDRVLQVAGGAAHGRMDGFSRR